MRIYSVYANIKHCVKRHQICELETDNQNEEESASLFSKFMSVASFMFYLMFFAIFQDVLCCLYFISVPPTVFMCFSSL